MYLDYGDFFYPPHVAQYSGIYMVSNVHEDKPKFSPHTFHPVRRENIEYGLQSLGREGWGGGAGQGGQK